MTDAPDLFLTFLGILLAFLPYHAFVWGWMGFRPSVLFAICAVAAFIAIYNDPTA